MLKADCEVLVALALASLCFGAGYIAHAFVYPVAVQLLNGSF